MMPHDIFVADDDGLGARTQRREARAKRRQQAAANDDVIAARIERDTNGGGIGADRRGHWPLPCGTEGASRKSPSAATISVTIASCGTSRDCTVRSDNA